MTTKQYGLINLKKAKSAVIQKRPNIFGDDSDDDSPAAKVEESLQKESLKAKMKRQTQIEVEKALAEDPTVYEYDSIFDQMESKKKEEVEKVKKSKENRDRKPKYIGALLKSAETRQREYERREERKVQKEREAEGEKFADKEAFVTSAYKKKMEELEKLEEKERMEAAMEAATDVTKQKDLSGFYRHLMRQTMGEEKGQTESYDRGVQEVKKEPDDDQIKSNGHSGSDTDESEKEVKRHPDGDRRDHKHHHEKERRHRDEKDRHHTKNRNCRRSHDSSSDDDRRKKSRYSPKRRSKSPEDDYHRKSSAKSKRRYSTSDSEESSRHEQKSRRSGKRKDEPKPEEENSSKDDKNVPEDHGEEVVVEKPKRADPFEKRTTADKASEARERYLARKRARAENS